MIDIKDCSWRTHIDDETVSCSCPRLDTTDEFPLSVCSGCFFADDGKRQELKPPQKLDVAKRQLLGDVVEKTLSKFGITKKRVEKWIGSECGCGKRKEKLNRLHQWAIDFFDSTDESAKVELHKLMDPCCVYLMGAKEGKTVNDRQVYGCRKHEVCTKEGRASPYASCETCRDKLTLKDKKLASKFTDPLKMFDREMQQTDALRNMLAGSPAFLVCGGPSARGLDLGLIEQRGCFSLAVNNMAAYYKASAFVCSDPPSKFHNSIWLDPQTFKFIPSPKMKAKRGWLRGKVGDAFEDLHIDGNRIAACHCPNVWGFERRSWWKCDETYFTEDSASWGNHDTGVKMTGEKKTVNTMLLGLRLLYHLGARRIYLVGVDFHMAADVGIKENYAFGELRDEGAITSNNNQYAVVSEWLSRMQKGGTFERFGLEIFNCNPNSRLRAFAHVPFDLAVDDALKHYPKTIDLEGWYEKKK